MEAFEIKQLKDTNPCEQGLQNIWNKLFKLTKFSTFSKEYTFKNLSKRKQSFSKLKILNLKMEVFEIN